SRSAKPSRRSTWPRADRPQRPLALTSEGEPVSTPKPADQYTAEEMQPLLVTGGKLIGSYPAQAAIHLLTFTELPGRRDFATLVDVEEVPDHDGQPVLAAFVRDWP